MKRILGLALGFLFSTAGLATAGDLNVTGSVGIGTSTPFYRTHVATTGAPQLLLEDTDQADGSVPYAYLQTSGGLFRIGTGNRSAGNPTGLSDNLVIDQNGYVGIGTTTPIYRLVVYGSGNQYLRVQDSSGSGDYVQLRASASNGAYLGSVNGLMLLTGTGLSKQTKIDSSGNFGIGTLTPSVRLDVRYSDNTQYLPNEDVGHSANSIGLQVFNTPNDGDYSGIRLRTRSSNSSLWDIINEWQSDHNGDLIFRARNGYATSNEVMRMYPNGNVHVTGQLTQGSSRTLKKDIVELSLEEAADTLESLSPVVYRYKADDSDLNVGFIAEDVPELVSIPERNGVNPMDIVAVLTKVVKEQQKMLEEQREIIQAQQKDAQKQHEVIADISIKLNMLEQFVSSQNPAFSMK